MARCHIEALVCMSNVELVGLYSRTKSHADILANEFGVKFVASSVSEHHVTQADGVVAVEETATRTNYH